MRGLLFQSRAGRAFGGGADAHAGTAAALRHPAGLARVSAWSIGTSLEKFDELGLEALALGVPEADIDVLVEKAPWKDGTCMQQCITR